MPEPALAMREMMRVTRAGGTVAAAVWDYADGMEMLRRFWDAAVELDPRAAPLDEKNMPLCRDGELEAAMNVERTAFTVEQSFASFEDYWSPFLLGTGPAGAYVKSLTDSARSALRARLEARAPFTLHSRAWAVRGNVPG